MSMKVFLDNATDSELVDLIKQKLEKVHTIEWIDEYQDDCYWVYLITPDISGGAMLSILSHVAFARKERLVICVLISHGNKSFSETKLQILRYIISILHSENSEIVYSIDDLIFFLEEAGWKHELGNNIGNKNIGVSDALEVIDKKNKKEEIEDANQ